MRSVLAALAVLATLAACERLGSGEAALAPPARGLAAYEAGAPQIVVTVVNRGNAVAPLALVAERAGHRTFETADGYALTFDEAGLLTATRGFGADMAASDVSQSAALIASGGAGQVTRYHGFYDAGEDVALRAYVCDIAPTGRDALYLIVTETCHNPHQSFTNTYWTRGGTIVESRQWAGEEAGTLIVVPRAG